MTESTSDMEAMAAQFADAALPFSDPEGAAARATAEPMSMYVERAAKCPVERIGDDFVVLLRMADILYVNKHHDVEQASKYLGSSRPAIPLGLDGAEHRKYRRLLDPVFTAKRVAPLAESVRALAEEMIDSFVADGEVRAYERWCEPLPSTIFLSILGLPLADLDDFLHFKSLTLGNEFATLPFDEAMARREEAVVWIHEYFNTPARRPDERRRRGRRPARLAHHDRGRRGAPAPRRPARHPRAADDRRSRHRRRVARVLPQLPRPAPRRPANGWSPTRRGGPRRSKS